MESITVDQLKEKVLEFVDLQWELFLENSYS